MNGASHLTITSEGLVYQGPLGEECFAWEHLTSLETNTFTLMGVLQITTPLTIENPDHLTPKLGEPIFPLELFNPQIELKKIDQKALLTSLERLHHSIKAILHRLHDTAPELSPHLLIPLAKMRSRLGSE